MCVCVHALACACDSILQKLSDLFTIKELNLFARTGSPLPLRPLAAVPPKSLNEFTDLFTSKEYSVCVRTCAFVLCMSLCAFAL